MSERVKELDNLINSTLPSAEDYIHREEVVSLKTSGNYRQRTAYGLDFLRACRDF